MNDNNINNFSMVANQYTMDNNEQRPTYNFTSSLAEKIIAIASWPLAFIYLSYLFGTKTDMQIFFSIFTFAWLVICEAMYWSRKRSVESIIFLILSLFCFAGAVTPLGNVWDKESCYFFTHLFVVYWVLCRSGRLAEGETSHLFVWDGITGFFVMTFKNFSLNVRTIVSIFNGKKKGNAKKFWIVVLALIAGIILLLIALSFLKSSDDNYRILINKIADFFTFKFDIELFVKLFFTPLFAMYFYGLFGGCYRETAAQVSHRGDNIKLLIDKLKKVPFLVWIILICLFSIFYVIYFGLQGSYLFDAFILKLPNNFTYSEYARQGFSEMCGVMIINFILLWLATRTGDNLHPALKIACAALALESILFSVIAFLKLYMYINAYGFTPLRLQSVWLVSVLFLACICFMVNMFTDRKTAKIWFIASSASLAILCLI